MAMMTCGGYGSRSYSYTVTETYTLKEAIDKASSGQLNPSEVYRQMPQQLQKEVDRLASNQFSQRFSLLTTSQQRKVMQVLKLAIEQSKEQQEKSLSINDALQMVKEGKLDDLKVYQALPGELSKIMDTLAVAQNAENFESASPEVRKVIVGFVLEMINKSADEEAKKREEAKQQAEEKAKRQAEEKAKRQAEEEAKRRMALQSARRKAKQCMLCGRPLGLFNRLLRREQHPKCTVYIE